MEDEIEVSIIIPLFNEEKYIENCIRSLIKQTYPIENMEWLLIDGCSNDKTVEIIKKYEDNYPIRILTNDKRQTPFALNIGIKNANGNYIIRLDAHAEFPPEYIEKCVFYLKNTDVSNVGGCAETVAEGFVGNAIAYMLSSKFGVGGSAFRTGKSGYVDTVPFGAFHKEVFDEVGMFNTELLRSEDNEMNARIRANGGKIYLAEDITFKYFCRNSISGILKMGFGNGRALFQTIRVDKKAMSLRHFIPFLFVLSLVIMPVLSMFSKIIYLIFLAEIFAYVAIDLFYSLRCKYGIVTIWLYPLFHIVYGMGSLVGLFFPQKNS